MEKRGRLICTNRNVWGHIEAPPPRRGLGSYARAALETARALGWTIRAHPWMAARILFETIFVAAVLWTLINL